jgi:hypothetical protein
MPIFPPILDILDWLNATTCRLIEVADSRFIGGSPA